MLKACLAIISGMKLQKNKSLKTIGKAPDINAFLRMLVDVGLEITIMLYILKVIL